jgi:glycosidase
LGSKRRSDDVGIIHEDQLSKQMVLTINLLIGGTPIVLYGEEIGLDQVNIRRGKVLEDSYYSNSIFSMKTRLLRENNVFSLFCKKGLYGV